MTDNNKHHASNKSEAKDPVCGMTVDRASAAGSVDHAGRTYYFCSQSCVEKFRTAPERYVRG